MSSQLGGAVRLVSDRAIAQRRSRCERSSITRQTDLVPTPRGQLINAAGINPAILGRRGEVSQGGEAVAAHGIQNSGERIEGIRVVGEG